MRELVVVVRPPAAPAVVLLDATGSVQHRDGIRVTGVDAGDPNVVAMWNRTGGSARYDRRRRWWTDHHDRFAAALL